MASIRSFIVTQFLEELNKSFALAAQQVWNLTNCRLKTNHMGHSGYLNCVTVSPDGSLCASGGKDGQAMLWDLNEGKHLYTLEGGDIINSMCFSPNRYWLCAAVGPSIKIWVCTVFGFMDCPHTPHP